MARQQVMEAHLKSLRGQKDERKKWLEALKMLKRARELPAGQEQLFASLSISYNALEANQKRMFLDTAFFIRGRRTETAMLAWERYGPHLRILYFIFWC